MIQGGDPTGSGSGGPGYQFTESRHRRRPIPSTRSDRWPWPLRTTGTTDPSTDGSQFFIVVRAGGREPATGLHGVRQGDARHERRREDRRRRNSVDRRQRRAAQGHPPHGLGHDPDRRIPPTDSRKGDARPECPPADGSAPRPSTSTRHRRCASTRPSATRAEMDTSKGAITFAPRRRRRTEAPSTTSSSSPATTTSTASSSTGSSPASSSRAATRREPGGAAPATASPTSCPRPAGTRSARWRWRTPDPTPTAASSSSSAGLTGAPCPPRYSLFGKVVKGLDVVQAIESVGSRSGAPSEAVTIESVTITEAD